MAVGSDPRIGTELFGYRIEEVIGRGGMGTVYRAEHVRLRRKVALKLLAPELAADRRFRDRFLRESEIAASLDHPNVVPIYDADEVDGVLYIAMRFVEGSDLRGLIDEKRGLDPRRAIALVAQAAAALDAAHERDLVHRDVKPANMLIAQTVGARDHLYLCDFGLSKVVSSISGLTATGQFLGTVDYVAPEQIRGETVDGRVDVYSLGCVLYESLAGITPYKRESEVAVIWAHVQEPPPSVREVRPDLPTRLDDVFARALAKSPEERYATCSELAAAAERAVEGGRASPPARALPRPRAVVPRLHRPSRRMLVAAIVALLVVAAAIVALVIIRADDSGLTAPLPANSLAAIDPKTNEITAAVPVGTSPGPVAAGEGGVWVANVADQTLSHLSPTSARVVKTIGLGFEPTAVAAGLGSVWVASHARARVVKIHPFTNEIEKQIRVGKGGVGETPLAIGSNAVWVGNENDFTIRRLDRSGSVVATLKNVQSPRAIAAAGAEVWTIEYVDEKVSRLDIAANRITRRVTVGEQPTALTIGAGDVWVGDDQENTVWRIDLGTAALTKTISVGDDPASLAYGAGAVWVANSRDGTVSRIDPLSGEVTATVSIGRPVQGIAVGAGKVWVAVD